MFQSKETKFQLGQVLYQTDGTPWGKVFKVIYEEDGVGQRAILETPGGGTLTFKSFVLSNPTGVFTRKQLQERGVPRKEVEWKGLLAKTEGFTGEEGAPTVIAVCLGSRLFESRCFTGRRPDYIGHVASVEPIVAGFAQGQTPVSEAAMVRTHTGRLFTSYSLREWCPFTVGQRSTRKEAV